MMMMRRRRGDEISRCVDVLNEAVKAVVKEVVLLEGNLTEVKKEVAREVKIEVVREVVELIEVIESHLSLSHLFQRIHLYVLRTYSSVARQLQHR